MNHKQKVTLIIGASLLALMTLCLHGTSEASAAEPPAKDQPYVFCGDTLGVTTRAEIMQRHPGCSPLPEHMPGLPNSKDQLVLMNATFADMKNCTYDYCVFNDKLACVSVSFDSEKLFQIKDAIIAKYGKPKGEITKVYEDQYGKKVECREITWSNSVSELTLCQDLPGIGNNNTASASVRVKDIKLNSMRQAADLRKSEEEAKKLSGKF